MKILLFGSTGMLGKVLKESLQRDYEVIAIDRDKCDFAVSSNINSIIMNYMPDIVINCVAIVDINLCETEKEYVYKVNAFAVAQIALACNIIDAKFIQISTDHYYYNEYDKQHSETDPIILLNYYAHSKFQGETYALLSKKHLIIRTNIIGFPGSRGRKGFLDWAIDSIYKQEKMTLFVDYFVSSIDVYQFSDILKIMILKNICGLYNVASKDVLSKAKFIEILSKKLNVKLKDPVYIKIEEQIGLTTRANSLGLDINKIENKHGINMPNAYQVIDKIVEVYYEIKSSNLQRN